MVVVVGLGLVALLGLFGLLVRLAVFVLVCLREVLRVLGWFGWLLLPVCACVSVWLRTATWLLWSRFALRGCFSVLAAWTFGWCGCYTDCLRFLDLASGCVLLVSWACVGRFWLGLAVGGFSGALWCVAFGCLGIVFSCGFLVFGFDGWVGLWCVFLGLVGSWVC